jgi:hypothetical protein
VILGARTANRLWEAANTFEAVSFARATHDPAAAQSAKLRGYLRDNAQTAFAREHGLTTSTTLDEFRRRVPVRSYAELSPYIERIGAGEGSVLTAGRRGRVEMFTPTSGSTGAEKLVPRTAALRGEFAAALAPWVNGMFADEPSLRDGQAYWSVSPVGHAAARRHGCVTVGFGDDDEYLSAFGRLVSRAVKAVPADVARARSMENWRYLTLLGMLRSRSLRMVSVWHPSFFTLLLDALPVWWDRLCEDLAAGRVTLPDAGMDNELCANRVKEDRARARELKSVSPADVRRMWPHLGLVSCWADGPAAPHARALEDRLGDVRVRSKGLLATEAFVSIPWRGMHPVALRSHFFEFEGEEGDVRSLHELSEGDAVTPILTTGGGLWRYRLPDRVIVDGFVERTPSIRFVGRIDAVSDLRGEKLSDAFVAGVLDRCAARLGLQPRVSVLAPSDSPAGARYTWYTDANIDAARAATDLDESLSRNPHYAYARRLGQLAAPLIATVDVRAVRAFGIGGLKGAPIGAAKPVSLCTAEQGGRMRLVDDVGAGAVSVAGSERAPT